jgi:polyisoprenoid-binding protein YceI
MIKYLSILLFASSVSWAATEPMTYALDDTHASIVFKVSHMGFSNVFGMFGQSSGKITWDAGDPAKSSFDVTVKTDSLNTMNKKRDEHLKGPDFFNVKQFPAITLKSKSIKKMDGNKYEVTGDLTIRGVTKPVKFTFVQGHTGKDPWGNFRTGGDAAFTVKRSDFGMNYMSKPGEIGDDVEMMISLEGVKK